MSGLSRKTGFTSLLTFSAYTHLHNSRRGPSIGKRGPSIGKRGPSIGKRGPAIDKRGSSIGKRGQSIGKRGPSIDKGALPLARAKRALPYTVF